jgi:hypothetical protein
MNGLFSRRCWPGLAGLVWLVMFAQGQAWERPPIKFKTEFKFHVEMKVGPEIKKPTAPWYAYFPADPRLISSPQTSPYPPWPQQFPPTSPPTDAKDLKRLSAEYASAPMPMMTPWASPYAYGSALQPVGYVPVHAPNYWYQNR